MGLNCYFGGLPTVQTASADDVEAKLPGNSITLDQLPVGVPAVVSHVQAEAEELARLQVMGVCVGRPIHTMRDGSRMIVCAAGTRIGLDKHLAAGVRVTVLPGGCPAGT